MPTQIRIAAFAELADGRAIGREVVLAAGVRALILTRAGDTVNAYLNSCPHTGIRLDWKPGRFFDVDERYLQCATHGALFEPGTGVCIAGPCVGRSLCRLAVEVRENDIVVDAGAALPPTALVLSR